MIPLESDSFRELKGRKTPNKEEVYKLNQCKQSYEVFLNSKGIVDYREYEYRRVKGEELPFTINYKQEEGRLFRGKQVNYKVDNDWLVGFDKGEWGGHLFCFSEEGSRCEKIMRGNIKNIFQFKGEVYLTEGLSHLSLSRGRIFKISRNNNKWLAEKVLDLPNTPYASTIIYENELLIVSSKSLLKLDANLTIQVLIDEGFWSDLLYPNSIVWKDRTIYMGMRAGILKIRLDDVDHQVWLSQQ
jgi:hypothetical protein